MKHSIPLFSRLFKKKSTEDMQSDSPDDSGATRQPTSRKAAFRPFSDRLAAVFGNKDEKNGSAMKADDKVFVQPTIEEPELFTSSSHVADHTNEVRENFADPPYFSGTCKASSKFINPQPLVVFPVYSVEYNSQRGQDGNAAGSSASASPEPSTTTLTTGEVEEKKGKKRARSSSPTPSSGECEDGPARRTRARISREMETTTPASENPRSPRSVNNSSSPIRPSDRQAREGSQQHSQQVSATTFTEKDKGKKRAREDSVDKDASEVATPAKKLKAADGSGTPSGSDSEAPATPSSTAAVDNLVKVADSSSSPSPAEPEASQRRAGAPLRRHHMRILYHNEENQPEASRSRPPRRFVRKPRSPSPDSYGPWKAISPAPSLVLGSAYRCDFGEEPKYRKREDGLTDGLPTNFLPDLPDKERLEAYRLYEYEREEYIFEEQWRKLEERRERSNSEDTAAMQRAHLQAMRDYKRAKRRTGDEEIVDNDGCNATPDDHPKGARFAHPTSTVNRGTTASTSKQWASPQIRKPAASKAAATTAPAPAPQQPRNDALPEYRKLRRHDTFRYGDKDYKSKAEAFGVLSRPSETLPTMPTSLYMSSGLWNPAVRERLMPGLSSYNAPMSAKESRWMKKTLNHYRKEMDEAVAFAAKERNEDVIELTTDGARLEMSRRLADPRDTDEHEDEREDKTRSSINGNGKLPRRK